MSRFPLNVLAGQWSTTFSSTTSRSVKDEVQGLLNSLCQVVNFAASLPKPICQADDLAKRGRNDYITKKRLKEQFILRKGESRLVDAVELTSMIGHKNSYLTSTLPPEVE